MTTPTKTRRRRPAISFDALFDAAARYAGATLRWRLKMGLGPIPEDFDPEGRA